MGKRIRWQGTGWPIVGHEWAVELLQGSLARGRLSHALLFTGPPQVGKTTLALILAAALTCQGETPPCGQCRSCRHIAHGTHPDVRLVEAEGERDGRRGMLRIDQIRELQRAAALAPMEARYKVFVLRELELANLPAANALLKTLEEPPDHVRLLLTSARPHALLPTIVSRCQVLRLRPLPLAQVADALEQIWQADAKQALLLARLSGGRLGWAVERLTDRAVWEERTQRLADVRTLTGQGRLERLTYAEKLSRNGEAVLSTLAIWTTWWRDLLLVQQGCRDYIINVDLTAELEAEAGRFAVQQVRHFLARLQVAPVQLRQNVNTRLLLETLLLRLPAPLS